MQKKDELLERIASTDIKNFLAKLAESQNEVETLIKESMPNVAPPKLKSIPRGRKFGKIVDNNTNYFDYNPYRQIKISMNEDVFNKYEQYCLLRNFTPSDFFIDLLYLLTHIDNERNRNPDITLRELCNNPTMLKLIFGE